MTCRSITRTSVWLRMAPLAAVMVLLPPASEVSHAQEPASSMARPTAVPAGFPDFGFMISATDFEAQYPNATVFRLKTDYPQNVPPSSQLPAALEIDFTKDWARYLGAVRDYCFAGNLPEWNPWQNEERDWYHIPWLHPNSESGYPPNGGTEGFRGLIKEAEVSPYQLAPTQTSSYQVYAVTLINDFAGYTMGRMWADPDNPDAGATDKRYGGGFLVGSVFCKLLFTDAPKGDDVVTFLENPLQWTGYITETWNSSSRAPLPLHLLQMDIMVRDQRADPWMGWVFGTFAYNGQLGNKNKFDNLLPLGMQWGNDPHITTNTINPLPPTKTEPNLELKETVINSSPDLPPQHLGWNGRLNGPADLNTSACMSCHSTAQYPALTVLVPPNAAPSGPVPPRGGGDKVWMKWFQNVPAATSTDPRAYSTDFSLQVAISLQNFWDAKIRNTGGLWDEQYAVPVRPVHRGGYSGSDKR